MKLKLVVILLSAFIFQACPPKENLVVNTENHRFEKEIQAFEKQDRENGIDKREILFVGSSSIRMWKTLKEDMQPYKVLNRGFGGATTPEVELFYDRIITPYKPKIIVVYVGENDISEGGKPEKTVAVTKSLLDRMLSDFKRSKIIYISMKPSISRWHLWDDFKKGNAEIKKICEANKRLFYLESADVMLQEDGSIRKDIFIEDGLHMNAKGYKDWTNMVKSLLSEL